MSYRSMIFKVTHASSGYYILGRTCGEQYNIKQLLERINKFHREKTDPKRVRNLALYHFALTYGPLKLEDLTVEVLENDMAPGKATDLRISELAIIHGTQKLMSTGIVAKKDWTAQIVAENIYLTKEVPVEHVNVGAFAGHHDIWPKVSDRDNLNRARAVANKVVGIYLLSDNRPKIRPVVENLMSACRLAFHALPQDRDVNWLFDESPISAGLVNNDFGKNIPEITADRAKNFINGSTLLLAGYADHQRYRTTNAGARSASWYYELLLEVMLGHFEPVMAGELCALRMMVEVHTDLTNHI